MPAPYYYYTYPFGQNADDLTSIPTNAAVDGSVSYFAGWTDPYELNLLTNPSALPIPRGQMNQLFYDITNNLQQYQQYGAPIWVTGNTVQYPIYARVYYSGLVYENQVANNTATPGVDATWLVISGGTQGVPVGTILDHASPIAPTGFLTSDGSAVSRTTYANLLSAITFSETGTLTVSANTVSGLSSTANMYVGMHLEGTNIPAGTTIASIVDSTDITLSANATASGAVSIKFFPWGNGDGSTTFNLPNVTRRNTIGMGGSSSSPAFTGTKVGQSGGEEIHTMTTSELVTHHHTGTSNISGNVAGGTPIGITFGANDQASNLNVTLTTADAGSSTPFNMMQSGIVVNKIIKYI